MQKNRKNDRVRLLHMRDSAQNAIMFANEISRDDYDADLKSQLAIARSAEIVGEAASNITDELQERHSKVAWSDIKGLRIRLAHAYDFVDLDILWDIATRDFPILIEQLEAILADETT